MRKQTMAIRQLACWHTIKRWQSMYLNRGVEMALFTLPLTLMSAVRTPTVSTILWCWTQSQLSIMQWGGWGCLETLSPGFKSVVSLTCLACVSTERCKMSALTSQSPFVARKGMHNTTKLEALPTAWFWLTWQSCILCLSALPCSTCPRSDCHS